MDSDLEARLRRALAARSENVDPGGVSFERVRTRIRRRAAARWTAASTAAAALLFAAVALPALTGIRVDLAPADQPEGQRSTAASPAQLVVTDGRRLLLTDGVGRAVEAIDVTGVVDGSLPITRVAVRPDAVPGALTVAYLSADVDCRRSEVGIVTVQDGDATGEVVASGGRRCRSDPVWSPDGDLLGWVERTERDSFELRVQRVAGGRRVDSAAEPDQAFPLDLAEGPAITELRLSAWAYTRAAGDRPRPVVLRLTAVHEGARAAALSLGVEHRPGGDVRFASATLPPRRAQRDGHPYAAVLVAPDPDGADSPKFFLGVWSTGEAAVWRSDRSDVLALPGDVLDPDRVEHGHAWLSAGGDTVVLGAGGHAWTARWEGDNWGELASLPGTVHAVVLPPLVEGPRPTPEPWTTPTP